MLSENIAERSASTESKIPMVGRTATKNARPRCTSDLLDSGSKLAARFSKVTSVSRSLRGRKVLLTIGAVRSAPEAVSPVADRAIMLLQRTQDLMLECRAVAQQFRRLSSQNNRSVDLVAALENGLMFTCRMP
jgi:hypothetical protein